MSRGLAHAPLLDRYSRDGIDEGKRGTFITLMPPLTYCSHAIVAVYDVLQDSIERFVDHKANSRSAVALRVPPLPFRLRRRTGVF